MLYVHTSYTFLQVIKKPWISSWLTHVDLDLDFCCCCLKVWLNVFCVLKCFSAQHGCRALIPVCARTSDIKAELQVTCLFFTSPVTETHFPSFWCKHELKPFPCYLHDFMLRPPHDWTTEQPMNLDLILEEHVLRTKIRQQVKYSLIHIWTGDTSTALRLQSLYSEQLQKRVSLKRRTIESVAAEKKREKRTCSWKPEKAESLSIQKRKQVLHDKMTLRSFPHKKIITDPATSNISWRIPKTQRSV